ncbi:MAG: hypothetical protein AOA66_0136 [Candidatus Bathyarchaeota archaeon BA2]|nr:MAG: hypothetical protein AOA66_0136 [Candidatus Bathyarchaeota archaeon BA2]
MTQILLDEYEKWKNRRKGLLSSTFLIGVLGFVSILTNIEELSWSSITIGLKIALGFYIITILCGCIGFLICTYKMGNITKKLKTRT